MQVDAVILSGGKIRGYDSDVPKGLVPIGEKAMVDYIVEAVSGCPEVSRIYLVSPSFTGKTYSEKVETVISDAGLLENLFAGLEKVNPDTKALIISGDVPLLTTEAVSVFIRDCLASEANGYYPIIPKEVVARKFPGTKRTYIQVKEGTFTGGNLVLVDPEIMFRNRELLERIYGFRKSPVKLAGILGFGFIINLLLKRLVIRAAEERFSEIMGARIITVVSNYPEMGIDIDKTEDLELAMKYLA